MTTVVLLPAGALGLARSVPAPRRLCTGLDAALLELRRAPQGSTFLVIDPPPTLDWAALRTQLRPLRPRVIVVGRRVPPGALPGALEFATLEAAAPLLAARPAEDRSVDPPAAPLTLIGASTGGPRALQELLPGLRPRGTLVIAQHLSAGFSDNLTQWLGTLTPTPVRTAVTGAPLTPGVIYVASAAHVTVRAAQLHLHPGQPGREYLPSIDRLLHSAAGWRGALNAVILTGMGDDGAEGLAALHRAGARTAVQAPGSATVPSMPAQALARVRPTLTADLAGLRAFLERHA